MERKRAVCRQVTKVKNKVPWRWWFQSSLSSAFTSTSSFRVFHSQVKTAQLGLTCPRHKLHARATHIHTHTTHTPHTHTHTHTLTHNTTYTHTLTHTHTHTHTYHIHTQTCTLPNRLHQTACPGSRQTRAVSRTSLPSNKNL